MQVCTRELYALYRAKNEFAGNTGSMIPLIVLTHLRISFMPQIFLKSLSMGISTFDASKWVCKHFLEDF